MLITIAPQKMMKKNVTILLDRLSILSNFLEVISKILPEVVSKPQIRFKGPA
jgi:hypothetical protein